MNKIKRSFAILLAIALVMTLQAPIAALAASEKANVPEEKRIYGTSWDSNAIEITNIEYGDTIDNLKSDNKNLVVKLTSENWNTDYADDNRLQIGIYTEKEGTYTVSFDIVNEKGKKKSSHKVKLYIYESPLETAKVNGKEMYNLGTLKSGKVTISLAKGNELKKLEYSVNNKNGETTYKKFKNGGKVTFNTKGDNNYWEDKDEEGNIVNMNMYDGLMAYTEIKITYIDKYTKKSEEIYTSFWRLAE